MMMRFSPDNQETQNPRLWQLPTLGKGYGDHHVDTDDDKSTKSSKLRLLHFILTFLMSEVYYNSELVMIMSMLDQHQKPVFSFFEA